jgi:CIC family chloride channel protein
MFSSSITFPHQVQSLWQKVKSLPSILVVIMLAPIIGVGAGFGAILMERLVRFVYHFFFTRFGLLESVGPFYLIIIPTLGGLLVGVILMRFARETYGRSVPEVLKSVVAHDEKIPPQSLAIKSLTSALCAGMGGSVGLGGPTGQLGSAIGAAVGQWLALSKAQIKLLFTCGIGAGIAAAFHAPFMGTIFAVEVILGYFSLGPFSAVLISAVSADMIAQLYKGEFVQIQHYALVSSWELLLYAILGVIIAFSSIGFTKTMAGMRKFWEKLPISNYLKPMLGGLLLGIVGLLAFWQTGDFPAFFGLGMASLSEALNVSLTFHLVLGLFLLKFLATSLTLSSGGAGGTFTPSFFMGAMLGATFGHLMNLWFPMIAAPTSAYAMAGMAAFVVGSMNAPLTALFIGFEIIGGYHIIWPIMVTILVSTLTIRTMTPKCRTNLGILWNNSRKKRYFPIQVFRMVWSCKVG